ncbi:MAG: endonuclease/exonuclease/phosphatase family protein [Vampirovibrionales bacterium]|nr:endonuclease/exonuclease/phosphatase family protein [Vampirovibrionales bacterium]
MTLAAIAAYCGNPFLLHKMPYYFETEPFFGSLQADNNQSPGNIDCFTKQAPLPYSLHHLKFGGEIRKVMTYNTETLAKKRNGEWLKSPQSLEALAKIILQARPDIIALQEVGSPDVLRYFNREYLRGAYPHIVQIPALIAGQQRNVAIMANEELELVGAVSHHKRFKILDCRHQHRDILEATFQTPSGYEFTLFSVHFKSMANGEKESQTQRLEEAQVLADIVQTRLKAEPDAHIIVAGDFNTLPDSDYGQAVLNLATGRSASRRDGFLSDPTLEKKEPQNATPTHQTRRKEEQKSKLDYIFVSPGLSPFVHHSRVVGTLKDKHYRDASDHLPVMLTFEEAAVPVAEQDQKSKPARHLDLAA